MRLGGVSDGLPQQRAVASAVPRQLLVYCTARADATLKLGCERAIFERAERTIQNDFGHRGRVVFALRRGAIRNAPLVRSQEKAVRESRGPGEASLQVPNTRRLLTEGLPKLAEQ